MVGVCHWFDAANAQFCSTVVAYVLHTSIGRRELRASVSFFFLACVAVYCLFRLGDAQHFRGIPTFFLNLAYFVALLAFLSSKHYNLDRVAAAIVFSFRFGIFVALLLQCIFLETRRAYLSYHEGPFGFHLHIHPLVGCRDNCVCGFIFRLVPALGLFSPFASHLPNYPDGKRS